MAEERSNYKHDASDKKLDKASEIAKDAAHARDDKHSSGPGHDAAEIHKHDDAGKDRLFEGRQQHDAAEKNSEKTRLARDVERHDHDADATDAGTPPDAKRPS